MTTEISLGTAIVEISKANAAEIYKDALQPSVRVLGKATAQCVSLFATPIGKSAEILEKNLKKYLDKLDGYSEEELIVPSARILVPILEKMRYIEDDVVSDYYAQILADASTRSKSSRVSIAFIEILNRLCSDELKILETIVRGVQVVPGDGDIYLNHFVAGQLPVINIQYTASPGAGYAILQRNISYFRTLDVLTDPDNYDLYLSNLLALGLLLKPAGVKSMNENNYIMIKNLPSVKHIIKDISSEKIYFDEGVIEVTELGSRLLDFHPRVK